MLKQYLSKSSTPKYPILVGATRTLLHLLPGLKEIGEPGNPVPRKLWDFGRKFSNFGRKFWNLSDVCNLTGSLMKNSVYG